MVDAYETQSSLDGHLTRDRSCSRSIGRECGSIGGLTNRESIGTLNIRNEDDRGELDEAGSRRRCSSLVPIVRTTPTTGWRIISTPCSNHFIGVYRLLLGVEMTLDKGYQFVRHPTQDLGPSTLRSLRDCREVVRSAIRETLVINPDGFGVAASQTRRTTTGIRCLDDTGIPPGRSIGLGPGGFDDLSSKEMSIGIDKSVDLGSIPSTSTTEGTRRPSLPQPSVLSPN